MNKYKKAWSNVGSLAMTSDYYKPNKDDNDIGCIEELVDKATPKKPLNMIITQFGLSIGDCPICKGTVVQGNGCAKCLQAIDWSEDD